MIIADLEQIEELVSKVKDPNHQGVFGNTLLHVVVEFKNSCKLVRKLINAGANVNLPNFFGLTPLHCAVIYRNHSAFHILIQSGAVINSKNFGGNSALHYSISNSMLPVLQENFSDQVHQHHSPDKWIIRNLLQFESLDINARNIRGETPLIWAVACEQLDVVKDLLVKSADVNISDCIQRTPLHIASSNPKPNIDIIFELLVHGASIYSFDNKGDSPVDIIVKRLLNPYSDGIAEILVKIIVLMHEINSFTIPKLEVNFQLLLFLKKCNDEVEQMKNITVAENMSLFKFLCKRLNENDARNVENEVYITIVETLLLGNHSIYSDVIVNRIPKFELCKILVQLVYTKNYFRIFEKESCFSLFSNLIINYHLSKYLCSVDIFNIIAALCFRSIMMDKDYFLRNY